MPLKRCRNQACDKVFIVTPTKKEFCGIICFRSWRANYRWSATADYRAAAPYKDLPRTDGDDHEDEFTDWSVEEDNAYYSKLRHEAVNRGW